MRNLSDFLFIYNVVDVVVLGLLFTNRVLRLRKDYFNLNLLMASSLSQYAYMGALTRIKVIIITYPYNNVMIKDFEEGVHGRHSLSPIRVGFDNKLIVKEGENKLERYVCFIEFYDENNQYGNAELKPKPYGYIQPIEASINKFLEILKTYDHEGDIGYFGVFDLSFNKASDQLIYYKNEL